VKKSRKTLLVIAAALSAVLAAIGISEMISPSHGDIDGDGRGDLVTMSDETVVSLLSMNGYSILSQTNLLDGQPIGAYTLGASSDINGDGMDELIFEYDGTHYAVYGGTNVAVVPLFGGSIAPWHAVAGGDYDGDGYGDIVFQYADSGYLAMALMNDTNVLSGEYLWDGMDIAPWHPVGGGDFNQDGKADLVLQAGDDSYYCVVNMDGPTVLYAQYVTVGELTDLTPWHVSAVTDLDGDLTSDLVLTGPHNENFALFMSNVFATAGDYIGGSTNALSTGTVIGPR